MAVTHAPLVAILGQHDVLAPDAVALLAASLAGLPTSSYADEDRLDDEGEATTHRC